MPCEELTLTRFPVLDEREGDSNPSDIGGSAQSDIGRRACCRVASRFRGAAAQDLQKPRALDVAAA